MLTIGPQKFAGTFNFFSGEGDPSPSYACSMVYVVDLNGDGMDEIISSGWETQPVTSEKYTNTQISIFGWDQGYLKDITENIFPNGLRKIEGTSELSFGDFNNDGLIDIFSSAWSDMDFATNAYEFINRGEYFEKTNLGSAVFQHGSAAADINGDGFCDIVATGYGDGPRFYFGGPDGLTEKLIPDYIGGSGVALGDFLGDGTISMVLTDHHKPSDSDTALFKFSKNSDGDIRPEFVSGLPSARFDLPLYDLPVYGVISDPWGHSHDVRATPFDFDSDGLLDVLAISRPSFDGETWPLYSEVQFLRNAGGGNFEDVTDTVRKGYVKETAADYAPKLGDFNGDGLTDIFLSEGSWDAPVYNSTTILMQQADHTFVDSYRQKLSNMVENGGGKAAIAQGPNSTYYLISELQVDKGYTSVKYAPLYFDGGIRGTDQSDVLSGSADNDQIMGMAGNDKLTSLDGDDTLNGGEGNDKLDGGRGIDVADYADALAGVYVNLAKSKAQSTFADDLAAIGIDSLKNIENVVGSDFDDKLFGSKFGNQLDGDNGNDTIDGGLGVDTLTGGSGTDRFVFTSKLSASNIDVISDFVVGEDQIQLSSKISSKLKATSNFFAVGAEANSPTNFVIYNSDSGLLSYDADGSRSKAAVAIALIGTGLELSVDDFSIN